MPQLPRGLKRPRLSLSPSPAGAPRNHSVGLSCPVWQREARTHVCVDVYVASHVWTGPCGQGVRAWQLQVCMCEPPGVCCVQKARVSTCPHAWSWPRRPHGCLPSCPPHSEEGSRSGWPRPRSPGRRPGQGGRPRPGQSAGRGLCQGSCFLSGQWWQLRTEGWPPSGRHCPDQGGSLPQGHPEPRR